MLELCVEGTLRRPATAGLRGRSGGPRLGAWGASWLGGRQIETDCLTGSGAGHNKKAKYFFWTSRGGTSHLAVCKGKKQTSCEANSRIPIVSIFRGHWVTTGNDTFYSAKHGRVRSEVNSPRGQFGWGRSTLTKMQGPRQTEHNAPKRRHTRVVIYNGRKVRRPGATCRPRGYGSRPVPGARRPSDTTENRVLTSLAHPWCSGSYNCKPTEVGDHFYTVTFF